MTSTTVPNQKKEQNTPSVSPISKREIFCRSEGRLVPGSITLTELRKAGAIKFLGVWIDCSVHVDSTRWDSDLRTRGDSGSIAECEWM